MGWLWTLQIIVDVILASTIGYLVTERKKSSRTCSSEQNSELHREDFERYQEALSDLCDRMNHEAEMWMTQLERKTKVVRQAIQEMNQCTTDRKEPVLTPPRKVPMTVEQPVTMAPEGRRGIREEAAFLRSQGYTVEQIARQLKVGQREIQLMLSLQPR